MSKRSIVGAALGAFVLLLGVVYHFSPSEYGFYPRCPFYAVTHLLCPGCGATRALYSLLHGKFAEALHYNLLFTLLVPFFLAWFGFWCYRVLRYDRWPRFAMPRGAALGLGIAAVLFAVARNSVFAF
jgi:uncharacterized protein DUF2752